MAKSLNIVFQGDSITDCGRMREDTAGFCSNQMGPGYPGLISAQLMCERPDVDWNFFNRGISGNRIVDLYARWKIDTLHLQPDVLSVMVGINDTWHEILYRNGVEVDRYERIFRELLQWTRKELPNCRFILLEPFMIAPQGDLAQERVLKEVAARAEAVRKLAAEFDAVLIRTQDLFDEALKAAPASQWTRDGVHLTTAGHHLLAKAWLEAAKDLLA